MDSSEMGLSDLVEIFKSWIPRWAERNEARHFWMPDDSCRVCYECDAQFTLFNRKHHCRICGRVFCNRCTANSVPTSALGFKRLRDEGERIRVCNYCYKQWQQEVEAAAMAAALAHARLQYLSPGLSPSPSATSLASTKSSFTANSGGTAGASLLYSARTYPHHVHYGSGHSTTQHVVAETNKQDVDRKHEASAANVRDLSPTQYGYCIGRSDDDDDDEDYGACNSDLEDQCFHQSNAYYDHVEFDDVDCGRTAEEKMDENQFNPLVGEIMEHKTSDIGGTVEAELNNSYEHADSFVSDNMEKIDAEPVDFENNGNLFFPPDPEDEEDEKDGFLFNEEEEDEVIAGSGYLHASDSFGNRESRNRERTVEEHRKAMQSVLDGHFRALVSQLLQIENLPEGEEGDNESWLEIVTSLSWEVASLLKPDTSKGGEMDPGGYAKIKCIASGRRSESSVLKGVVCRKNLANRRMKSRIEKPRLLILGGALEYQRVSNLLSSFDTLLQQEMDHLKMAVAKIDAHQPDVLLVEKSVSRFAQEYLLAKDISLILNIKRPLLERIARCTGAQIIPSIDHLSLQKLGHCGLFHVQKFVEEHSIAATGGAKPTKTLLFFEGCPKPLGCTVLLRGADRDELKKVKHVVQYAVFAAYHLAIETSFLADEGASNPELPFSSPITVALPEKASLSAIGRSISTISGFAVSNPNSVHNGNNDILSDDNGVSQFSAVLASSQVSPLPSESERFHKYSFLPSPFGTVCSAGNLDDDGSVRLSVWEKHRDDILRYSKERKNKLRVEFTGKCDADETNHTPVFGDKSSGLLIGARLDKAEQMHSSQFRRSFQDNDTCNANQEEEELKSADDFPPLPSDHQSILVHLSTRRVSKGTVCERAHLFRIKYYGSTDKPLGRFLRDHLFDQGYRCRFCEMPSEAHVHCYIHRHGSLTISVRKLLDFLLPGERDGKIWMWHKCLKCPRRGGMPPETRRVVMSDAAWGLSFGKFLELSFSNHASASRVASCGHSLHRDCLRFYGFGKMVACFRYASIDVNSVYLPPSQLDFSIQNADWIQKEVKEVVEKANLLFSDVLNGINRVSEKVCSGLHSNLKLPDSKLFGVYLRGIWQREKSEFEEFLYNVSDNNLKKGQPDIIEINKLHRRLLFHAYLWDRRLSSVAGFYNSNEGLENPVASAEELAERNSLQKPLNFYSNQETSPVDIEHDAVHKGSMLTSCFQGGLPARYHPIILNHQEGEFLHDTSMEEKHLHNLNIRKNNEDNSFQSDAVLCRAFTEVEVTNPPTLTYTLDGKRSDEGRNVVGLSNSNSTDAFDDDNVKVEQQDSVETCCKFDLEQSFSGIITGGDSARRDLSRWVEMPFSSFYSAINKGYAGDAPLFHILQDYNPVYVSSFRELDSQGGARVLLPLGIDDIFIPIFDDEPASIVCHALVSTEYHSQMAEYQDRINKDCFNSTTSFPASDMGCFNPSSSFDESMLESTRSVGVDDSMLSILSSSSIPLDPIPYSKNLHIKVSFTDECPPGKMRYSVTCYYAMYFQSLRRICCPHELDFVKSLSRCKKWGAQGGKSNVFFAKSLDDRFIIKQVTKTELESFIQFAPRYFKYLSDSIQTRSPTCLAKILGIYQVSSKCIKGGKECKMDVLVMENLLYGRKISRLYDLKGSSRSRYNADLSGDNKVLLDQNLIESMTTSPIFVGNKAKRLLERAVWNDTSFLASIGVMDYSLLVGVDEERHELVLGIIDFMRQYTWDKQLETWVKASGILGGPKNSDPTVILPEQYKKRFRKAMAAYFLMVPDQWSPPPIVPSRSQSDFGEEG